MNNEQGLHHIDTDIDTDIETPDVFDRVDYYMNKALVVLIWITVGMFTTAGLLFWGML